MLFGGNSGSCGGCGCKSCQYCNRECTNPHTGSAFETAYTLYFEGAEAGNPNDGYLYASGDSDTSDPYDGMDGVAGPWYQQVGGTFTLQSTTTRFPCYVYAMFWRSNFVLGASTIPPPSSDLTLTTLTVKNLAPDGSQGAIVVESSGIPGVVAILSPGEEIVVDPWDPDLVAGAGAQAVLPLGKGRAVRVRQFCGNEKVVFSITARIEWNTRKRQHVIYGKLIECYESSNPCSQFCNGGAISDVLYLELTNFTGSGVLYDSATIDGTYVMERIPNTCRHYEATFIPDKSCYVPCPLGLASYGHRDTAVAALNEPGYASGFLSFNTHDWHFNLKGPSGENLGCYADVVVSFPYRAALDPPCGSGVLATGVATADVRKSCLYGLNGRGDLISSASVDWKIFT